MDRDGTAFFQMMSMNNDCQKRQAVKGGSSGPRRSVILTVYVVNNNLMDIFCKGPESI